MAQSFVIKKTRKFWELPSKIANFTISTIMALWDSAFLFDFESSGFYQSMVHQNTSSHNIESGSKKLSFTLAIVAFCILQVRLEIQNYRFGEGFFIQLKRWWTDSHQDETHENEEYGVNFQRIMTLMLSICAIFFFTGGVIYFKDYSFFWIRQCGPSRYTYTINCNWFFYGWL